jgi:ankyrin repeat protein
MYWVHVVVLLSGVLGISLPASAIAYSADMTDAAYDGDIETVKRLLAEDRDINDTYGCQENALHQAVRGEHLELVKFLLCKGININQRSCGGKPMDFAMRTGNAKIICVLLDHSVKPETRYGEISIQAALGNTKKVQQLLEQETDRKELLESSLLVIRLGKPKMLPLFVPSKTPATKSHFMAAVDKGDVESAKYLIKHGFSFDNSGDIGRDAVVSAIQNGRVPMLRWLLKQKISPAKDPKEDGRSPL